MEGSDSTKCIYGCIMYLRGVEPRPFADLNKGGRFCVTTWSLTLNFKWIAETGPELGIKNYLFEEIPREFTIGFLTKWSNMIADNIIYYFYL